MNALSPAAADVLRAATATETDVALPGGQLDRKVYEEVNKALTRIGGGGKWNRGRKVHIFPRDPRPELAALVGSGEMPVDQKKAMAFFATPTDIARQVAEPAFKAFLNSNGPFRVLEPSAGDGAIADVLREMGAEASLTLVEPDPDRWAALVAKGYEDEIGEGTFEEFAAAIKRLEAAGTEGILFDAIIMNPPFSSAGHPVLWAEHVLLAWSLLKPGGVLSAIIPDSLTRQHKTIAGVREIASLGTVKQLPEGAFKESGTGVRTAILTATKPEVTA